MVQFDDFIARRLSPKLNGWYRENSIPREIYPEMAEAGWLGYEWRGGRMAKKSGLRETLVLQRLARVSPGFAVTVLIVSDLGLMALGRFGSQSALERYGQAAVDGKTLICVGNTENLAGSDVAGIAMSAAKADGGWVLDGTKAYVTNGLVSDLAVVTAVSDPEAERNRRMSMFLVDLSAPGVTRKRLNKQVWVPSDLTRIAFSNVFVPEEALMGERGRGLQQMLAVFTNSRVPISGLALGTAEGAFEAAFKRGGQRKIFGRPVFDFQAKGFEAADLYARMEAARLTVYRAAAAMDSGRDFRFEASLAKYLSVQISKEVAAWAADMFGAGSVIREHPIHKFPMDAWAVSLAEGTQDVQKLIIFLLLLPGSYSRPG